MVNGYLLVIYASDGGENREDQGIEFWDVSDPRTPKLVARHQNEDTRGLREAHAIGLSNSYPGDYMVTLAREGIQFWDVSDPFNISLPSYMRLPDINRLAYQGTFWLFWQAPYVYVAATVRGLCVVDAGDPTDPVLVNRINTGRLVGVSPWTVFALGNLLVLADTREGRYLTMDISDPANPRLIERFDGKRGYSHIVAGGKILTSGGNGDANRMYVFDLTHDGTITYVGEAGAETDLSNGGYGSYQDGFFHSGFTGKYAKFDIANLKLVGTGSSGLSERDEDFGQVLGNVVFVGDDRGVSSALIVHQTEPDTIGRGSIGYIPAMGPRTWP